MLKKLVLPALVALLGCSSPPVPKPVSPPIKKAESLAPIYETSFSLYGFTIRKKDARIPAFRYMSDSVTGYNPSLFPDLCELDLGDVQIRDKFCDGIADEAAINGKYYKDENFTGDVKTKAETIYTEYWEKMDIDARKAEFEKMRSSETLDKYL